MGLSLSLFGVANLKKQFLTKVERQHPKNINTLPKWFLKELWDSPETKQLQKFAHMKDFCSPCRGEVSHKQAAHNAVGNSVAWRASQGSNESWAVCVDTAPFPLGIYYLLKTNLLVSGSSGFLRASCNISPGLQSHN